MHNQYSPYLLKASLPTAVAAALLSFAQMANSTVTDYSPDFSNAGERQKFCVHGIIGARQTGASNEHEHQTQFS